MSGLPLGAVLQGDVVRIVLTQTRFGEDWLWRGALVVVLAACLLLQGARSWKQIARWIALIVSAALVASLIWAGHGAAADDLPFDFLHFPADLLHLLTTGAWLGALVPLAVFLTAARGEDEAGVLLVVGATTSRFSVLGVTCVAILVATGIVNTWFLSGSIPALAGTLYGRLLLLKVAIFIGMIALARVNHRRLVPFLAHAAGETKLRVRAVRELAANVLGEATLGIFVLGIVGVIGILAPGLHTEPNWPFPFRLDLGEVAAGAQKVFDVAAALFVLCLAAGVVAAERQRLREVAASFAGIIVFGAIAGISARPGIVEAYPTTYYAPTQPYAASSVSRGAPLYAANCTICHGAGGRGNGRVAATLPVRPADLTEEHIFAHKVGDLFWWVSHGKSGVMPGFVGTLNADQRWDVIQFVLARAAGVQTNAAGSQITSAAAPPIPDFAFDQNGAQNTLSQSLKTGPVLLVLFSSPVPDTRLAQLAALEPRLVADGLHTIAVDLQATSEKVPMAVQVSSDVRAMLGLFRTSKDGPETELMLDRSGSVRARWTVKENGGLADADTLLADAVRVARIPAAAANHAGHGG